MYGGGFDGGGQFGGDGGQFGGDGGGQFGGAAQFAPQGGFSQGGAGMGSQGGGFAVDNSTPDGKAKGNKDRQSLIPCTIKQLKNAPAQTSGEQGFTLDGKDLYQVTVVGLITSADEQSTNLQYMVDDGTDSIMVKMWVDADADEAFAERRAQWKAGVVVRVIGQLRSFNNSKSLVAYSIQPLTDFNEYTFHFIEVVHTHLRHTKGPPVAPQPLAVPVAGMPTAQFGAAPAGASYAAPAAGQAVQDLVLKFFQSKGEDDDSGCTIDQAAAALGGNGITAEQVRSNVESLVNDGHLYSTIDDDHYKATS